MILVDAGYPLQIGLIEEVAKQKDIILENLTHIIITHHDFDHIGSLYEFKQKYPQIKENKTFIAGDALVLMNEQLVIPYPEFAYDADQAKESVKALFPYEIENFICYHGGI